METDFQVLSNHSLENRLFRFSCKRNQTAKKAQHPNSLNLLCSLAFSWGISKPEGVVNPFQFILHKDINAKTHVPLNNILFLLTDYADESK